MCILHRHSYYDVFLVHCWRSFIDLVTSANISLHIKSGPTPIRNQMNSHIFHIIIILMHKQFIISGYISTILACSVSTLSDIFESVIFEHVCLIDCLVRGWMECDDVSKYIATSNSTLHSYKIWKLYLSSRLQVVKCCKCLHFSNYYTWSFTWVVCERLVMKFIIVYMCSAYWASLLCTQ